MLASILGYVVAAVLTACVFVTWIVKRNRFRTETLVDYAVLTAENEALAV